MEHGFQAVRYIIKELLLNDLTKERIASQNHGIVTNNVEYLVDDVSPILRTDGLRQVE